MSRRNLTVLAPETVRSLQAAVLTYPEVGGTAGVAPNGYHAIRERAELPGAAYGTLPGHPESGEEAFVLQRLPDGSVVFEITAFSHPGTWWSRLGAPAARLVQRVITRRYLRVLG